MSNIIKITDILIPSIVFFIILFSVIEKKKVFNIFLKGVNEGIKIIYKIFPTMIAIFLVINIFKNSGLLDVLTKCLSLFTDKLNFPREIIPLVILRPISGSASLGILTNILKENGVDSKIGLIASTIMASTETTLYIITLYTSSIGVKKIRFTLIAGIMADIIGIIISAIIWNIFF